MEFVTNLFVSWTLLLTSFFFLSNICMQFSLSRKLRQKFFGITELAAREKKEYTLAVYFYFHAR